MADDGMLDKLDVSRLPAQQEISGRVIELWIECETELLEHGVTDHAKQLDWQVRLAMGMAPGTRIHRLAYPDARSRPTRLSRRDV